MLLSPNHGFFVTSYGNELRFYDINFAKPYKHLTLSEIALDIYYSSSFLEILGT